MKRIAVVFSRFGPYHAARLEAAGLRFASRDVEVLGVEVADRDRENPWDAPNAATAYRKVTLFPGSDYRDLSPSRIRHALSAAFAAHPPDCAALPGWIYPEALAGLRWCVRCGVPAILMSESSRRDFPRHGWREWIKRCVVRNFSAALVGGRTHASYAIELGVPETRIFLGYDAVDNAYFSGRADAARAEAEPVRARLSLPPRFFLASCRFVHKKNLSRLLDAYAAYRKQASEDPWDLVVCGDGPLRAVLHEQALRLQIDTVVHFPGFVGYRDLPDYYALAGAFVHPSISEQWGLVVNEAMAAGLPVLVSRNCGSASELVQEGINGSTFDPRDSVALASLLMEVAHGEVDRTAMGLRSRDIVGRWSTSRFAEGLEAAADAVGDKTKTATWHKRLPVEILTLR